MAKKKAGKVIQMLSPENYIRTKARTLPIHECMVNAEWQEAGFANIIIARGHNNGNITVCFYLIDLYCLGIKDTHYMFNISKGEYQNIFNKADNMNLIPISYTLAHNIIYAGLEYAEEFGFKPHKDFTSITRFMLEEDTEDIELIDIECGKDGKPFYVSGPFDDEFKMNAITKQLEKTAGVGNFNHIEAISNDLFDREKEDDKDWEDEFKGYTFEEKKKLFVELESRKEILNDEEDERFINICNSIIEDIKDPALFNKYYAEFDDDFDIEITNDEISDEMLGILPGSTFIQDETRNLFPKIYYESAEDTGSVHKLLERIKKQTPDIPASAFLELVILKNEDSSEYAEKLKEYTYKFPDYSLIKLLFLIESLSSDLSPTVTLDQSLSLHSAFPGRTDLHTIEIIHYVMFNLLYLSKLGDPSKLKAFIYICEELELEDADVEILDGLLKFAKMRLVNNYLKR